MAGIDRVSTVLIGLAVAVVGFAPVGGAVIALFGLLLRQSKRAFPAAPSLLVLGAALTTSALVNSSDLITAVLSIGVVAVLLTVIYLGTTRITKRDAASLLAGSAVLLLVQLFFALNQILGQGLTRAHGTTFHANQLGFLAALMLPLYVSWAFRSQFAVSRIFAGLGALTGFTLIGLSGSRSALVSALLASLLIVLMQIIQKPSRRALVNYVAPGLVGVGLVIAALGVSSIRSTDGLLDPAGRAGLWETALVMVSDRPVLGYGPGGWLEFAELFEPQLRTDRVPHPHNLLLELSVLGGLSTMFAFVWLFSALARSVIELSTPACVQFGLAVCLVVLVCTTTDSVLTRIENLLLFVMMLGLASAHRKPDPVELTFE